MITLKRGDTGIGIKFTLSNLKGDGNLTDADISFLIGDHEIIPQKIEAENGVVMVVFEQEYTEKTGYFNCEFKVKYKDGRIETFPSDGFAKVRIMDDLGGL